MNNKISDSRAIRALIGNVCVKSAKNVFQIFLNIYIWKHTQDIQVVALFNLIYLTTHMVFFTVFAPIVKRGYRKFLHIFSLVWFAAVYLWVMYLWPAAIDHLVAIPIAIWFFNSIYWITYHNTQFDLTTHANRGNYEGIRKALRQGSSIIIPVFVGFLISLDYMWYGYQMAFAFGAAILLLWAFIWAVSPETSQEWSFQIGKVFKKCTAHKDVFRVLYTHSFTAFSFSNSIIEVLVPIILFSYVLEEVQVGAFVSFFAIASIFASYFFGKFVSYRYYKKSIFFLGMGYAFALLGFVIFSSIEYLVISSTLITAFAILFSIPQKVMSDNVLHKLDGYKQIRAEYMVIREWFQAVGWILTFLLLYFIGSVEREFIQIIFGVMIVSVVWCTLLLSRVDISKN